MREGFIWGGGGEWERGVYLGWGNSQLLIFSNISVCSFVERNMYGFRIFMIFLMNSINNSQIQQALIINASRLHGENALCSENL